MQTVSELIKELQELTNEEKQRYSELMRLLSEPMATLRKQAEEVTGYTVCYEIYTSDKEFKLSHLWFMMKYGNHHYKIKCYPITDGIHGLSVWINDKIQVCDAMEAYNWYLILNKAENNIKENFRKQVEPLIPESIWSITA
jgi:hypothetical protein